MKPDISVVIMAFNEKGTLSSVVKEIDHALKKTGGPHEIIIIDDGSSDGTGELADGLTKDTVDTRVVHHGANQGLGSVYRTGFNKARGECLTFFPADGQFSADIINKFFTLMGDADIVLGYIPDRKGSIVSRFLSWGERLLFALLFGRLPSFQGIMMIRRNILDGLGLVSSGRGWAIVMELIIRAKKAGYRIISVPIEIRPRISGYSKVSNVRTVLDNLKQAIALRWRI